MLKRLTHILVILLSAVAIERLCHKATDGFQIVHITSPFNYGITHTSCSEKIRSALDKQKFLYLGKGAQNYVFGSTDGRLVLKLFKFQRHSLHPLVQLLPLPGFLEKWREEKNKRKQEEMEKLFQSYQIAFAEMPNESALVALHLSKSTDLKTEITLVDRLNIEHQIDADSCEFVLQEKAELVIPALKRFREKKDLEGAKRALVSLLALVHSTCQKGILNCDPHLSKNFGFIEDRAVLIDCGDLCKKPELPHDPPLKSGALKAWLAKEWPELYQQFEEMTK